MNIAYTTRLSKIESILIEKLPTHFTTEWKKNVFGTLPKGVSDPYIENLVKPCRDLLLLGGKRWRPLLLVLCSELISGNEIQQAYEITPLVELVHTASLIHDDIEDKADTRRGKPSAHITYGIDTAINSGSWLYFQAGDCISTLDSTIELRNQLYETYLTEVRRLHLGQCMDIGWHNNNNFIPSIEEYTAMVRLKTGTLASLSAQIGVLIGGGTKEQAFELGQIAADIGVGFQILDDVINLTTGNKGKKRGDDIVEGKKSLPVILHIENKPEDLATLSKYFKQAAKEGPNSEAVEKSIQLLNSSNAIEKALCKSKEMISESCNKILTKYNNNKTAELVTQLFSDMLI